MKSDTHPVKVTLRLLLVLAVLLAASLACNMPGNEPPPPDTTGTEVALELTKISLDMTQQALDAQAQAQAQATQPPPEQQPAQEEPAQEQPADNTFQVSFEGVSFSVDRSLASNVSTAILPSTGQDVQAPAPEMIEFRFEGYARADTFHDPRILVFAVADYEAINDWVGESARNNVADLQAYIAGQPMQRDQGMPFMPFWPAAQMIDAKVQKVDFQNGSGARYITQFGQAISPVTKKDAFYTYQGLTADNRYYVVAIMPVSHEVMADSFEDISNGDFDAFANNYETYINDMRNSLNNAADDTFNPSLSLFDSMVQTIRIDR